MNIKPHRGADFHRSIGYVLNPKNGKERVGFIQSRNLGTENFADEMQTTVNAARALQARHRQQNNQRAQASGAEPKRSCYHFSISWHKDDQPTDKQMREVAHAALKALKLDGHQNLVVSHTDTAHRHVHVVANLVNPKTGQVASLRNDIWILNKFAYAREMETGTIRSFQRAAKMEQKKPDLSRPAQREADHIKKTQAKTRASIKAKHEQNYKRRAEQKDAAWTEFKAQKADIQKRYKIQIDRIWKDTEPHPNREPKPDASLFPKLREWVALAKAVRQTGTVAHPDDLKPDDEKKKKGRLPAAIEDFAQRKERSDDLKKALKTEIGQLAMLHERRLERMQKNHEHQIQLQKDEWKSFKNNSIQVWKDFREKHNIDKKQERAVLKGTFANKSKAPDKAEKAPATVQEYVDAYIDGKGRDSKQHEQFAANHAEEIEAEFARRHQDEVNRQRRQDQISTVTARVYHAIQPQPSFSEATAGPFRLAATVDVPKNLPLHPALDYVFDAMQPGTQAPELSVIRAFGCNRSTAVGDMIQMHGGAYICARSGWREVTESSVLIERESTPAEALRQYKRSSPTPTTSQVSPEEATAQFTDFLRKQGFDIKCPIEADGKWHHLPLDGQRSGRSGGYVLHTDGIINGQAKNHKTGVLQKWKPEGEPIPLTQQERKALAERAEAATQRKQAETRERQDDAAKRARLIWDQCQPASPDHAYLQAKNISPHGIRQCREDIFIPSNDPAKQINLNRALVIPRYNANGQLRSLQAVTPSGYKMNQTGAEKRGTCFILGHITPDSKIVLAEGYSTGAAIHEATSHPVAIAFDAGNLIHIAKELRQRFPEHDMIIASDNDAHLPLRDPPMPNIGVEKAQEAAEAVNAVVITPTFNPGHDGTDWQDYRTYYGDTALASHFPSSIESAPEHTGADIDYGGYDR